MYWEELYQNLGCMDVKNNNWCIIDTTPDAREQSPGDRLLKTFTALCGACRQGMLCQVTDPETMGLSEDWRLTARVFRQVVCTGFTWQRLGYARR